MKIYRIAYKRGSDFLVNVNRLWTSRWKMEEVCEDIRRGELSFSRGKVPVITRSLEFRNMFIIMDGHHRIVEDIINGDSEVLVHWEETFPYIDAGIGNDLPQDRVKVLDYIKQCGIVGGEGENEDIQNSARSGDA